MQSLVVATIATAQACWSKMAVIYYYTVPGFEAWTGLSYAVLSRGLMWWSSDGDWGWRRFAGFLILMCNDWRFSQGHLAETVSLTCVSPRVVSWDSSLNGGWVPSTSMLRVSQMEAAASVTTLPPKSHSVICATFGLLEVNH